MNNTKLSELKLIINWDLMHDLKMYFFHQQYNDEKYPHFPCSDYGHGGMSDIREHGSYGSTPFKSTPYWDAEPSWEGEDY